MDFVSDSPHGFRHGFWNGVGRDSDMDSGMDSGMDLGMDFCATDFRTNRGQVPSLARARRPNTRGQDFRPANNKIHAKRHTRVPKIHDVSIPPPDKPETSRRGSSWLVAHVARGRPDAGQRTRGLVLAACRPSTAYLPLGTGVASCQCGQRTPRCGPGLKSGARRLLVEHGLFVMTQ